ncbi:hypothetical protein ACPPVT_21400 [Angustibacter sp. McL0619]|uniref:hypothetical protein n=1 Tax=Angustibacter sp. McL0619 TaxID=3415676 RepID=UPI003CF3C095
MGYEELDSDGAGRAATPASSQPIDVIALDDLPDPRAGLDDRTSTTRRPPPWLERVLRRATRGVAATSNSHPWRWLGGLTAVTATAGLVLGVLWSGHQAERARVAEARGAVSAFATVGNYDRVQTSEGPAADFSIRVYNVGSTPLRLVTTARDLRLTYFTPQVSLSSGTDVIAPQASETVISRLLLDCDNTDPVSLSVPVRPPDGSLHQLTVADSDNGLSWPTPKDLCNQLDSNEQALDAGLGGTLAKPTLQLRNTGNQQLTVDWQFDLGSGFGPDRRDVQLSSRPALPLTLQPSQTREVALTLTVSGCGSNRPIENYTSLGFVNLRAHVGPVSQDGGDTPVSGVDLSAVVGAALQRSCR